MLGRNLDELIRFIIIWGKNVTLWSPEKSANSCWFGLFSSACKQTGSWGSVRLSQNSTMEWLLIKVNTVKSSGWNPSSLCCSVRGARPLFGKGPGACWTCQRNCVKPALPACGGYSAFSGACSVCTCVCVSVRPNSKVCRINRVVSSRLLSINERCSTSHRVSDVLCVHGNAAEMTDD